VIGSGDEVARLDRPSHRYRNATKRDRTVSRIDRRRILSPHAGRLPSARRDGGTLGSPAVTAAVRGFTTSLTSVQALEVSILFSNHADRIVTVDSYEVIWPRGHKLIADIWLPVGPRSQVSRTCNIDLIALDGLTKDDFRVDIHGSR
jgi:hypothetical protein